MSVVYGLRFKKCSIEFRFGSRKKEINIKFEKQVTYQTKNVIKIPFCRIKFKHCENLPIEIMCNNIFQIRLGILYALSIWKYQFGHIIEQRQWFEQWICDSIQITLLHRCSGRLKHLKQWGPHSAHTVYVKQYLFNRIRCISTEMIIIILNWMTLIRSYAVICAHSMGETQIFQYNLDLTSFFIRKFFRPTQIRIIKMKLFMSLQNGNPRIPNVHSKVYNVLSPIIKNDQYVIQIRNG